MPSSVSPPAMDWSPPDGFEPLPIVDGEAGVEQIAKELKIPYPAKAVPK